MRKLVLFACISFVMPFAMAADLTVANAWIRLLAAGLPAGGYFELKNAGNTEFELVGAKSSAFGRVMLHQTLSENLRSRMVHVDKIAIPPGSTVSFKPGGYHLMLMKPLGEISVGSDVPITFVFSNGEEINARFEVRGPAGDAHGHGR